MYVLEACFRPECGEGVMSRVRYHDLHEVPGVYKAATTLLDSGGAV